MQRSDGRRPDEDPFSLNFEVNVAPHASGLLFLGIAGTNPPSVIFWAAWTIEEGVPAGWDGKAGGYGGGLATAEYSGCSRIGLSHAKASRYCKKGALLNGSAGEGRFKRLIWRALRSGFHGSGKKLGSRTILD